jgi:hypothetical protein
MKIKTANKFLVVLLTCCIISAYGCRPQSSRPHSGNREISNKMEKILSLRQQQLEWAKEWEKLYP